VGPLESDNIFSITPEVFVAALLKDLRDLDFASSDSHVMGEGYWILEVPNAKHSERHGFIFKKMAEGWKWISFATSGGSLFEFLYEQKLKTRK
jgi:hypothetical protein